MRPWQVAQHITVRAVLLGQVTYERRPLTENLWQAPMIYRDVRSWQAANGNDLGGSMTPVPACLGRSAEILNREERPTSGGPRLEAHV